jgi:hypothetical protein
MPKTKISEYSSTSAGAALNTDIASINIDEGCAPSGINNAIRALMAQVKDLQSGASGDTIPVLAGGTGAANATTARSNLGLVIGTNVLAPPSGTAILKANSGGALANATAGTDYVAIGTASTFTASQRGTITTDNDGSFDMNVTNNFLCTPTATFALTFTNITAGQSGYVLLVNTGGYAVTAAATTKVGTTFLTGVSAAGTYLLSYFSNGTNVYVTASGVLA